MVHPDKGVSPAPLRNHRVVADYFLNRPLTTAGYTLTMLTFPLGVVGIPAVMGALVDDVRAGKEFVEWRGKLGIVIGMFVAILTAYMIGMYLDARVRNEFTAHIRDIMVDRLMLSRAYSYRPVQVTSTTVKYSHIPRGVFELVRQFRVNLVPGLVTMLAITGYFFYVEPRLGVLVTLLLVGMICIMMSGKHVCQDGLIAAEYGTERMLERQGDVLETIFVTLSTDAREYEKARRKEWSAKQVARSVASFNCANHFTLVNKLLVGMFVVVIIIYVWARYTAGKLSAAKFMSTLFVLMCSRHILSNAMESFPYILETNADLQKLYHYLDELDDQIKETRSDDRDASTLRVDKAAAMKSASVVFEDVTFRYREAKHDNLKNVSFALEAGNKMLVSGHIGSGKSTMAKMVLGMFVPAGGAVTVCGYDVSTLHRKELSKLVAYIPQNAMLMDRSVDENLRHGLDAVSRADVRRALKTFNVDFIGIDDRVGKGGERLSGGQRTTLMLIKAMLQDTPIIIADELTANLDPGSTVDVLRTLDRVSKDRVLIFISHNNPPMVFSHSMVFDHGRASITELAA